MRSNPALASPTSSFYVYLGNQQHAHGRWLFWIFSVAAYHTAGRLVCFSKFQKFVGNRDKVVYFACLSSLRFFRHVTDILKKSSIKSWQFLTLTIHVVIIQNESYLSNTFLLYITRRPFQSSLFSSNPTQAAESFKRDLGPNESVLPNQIYVADYNAAFSFFGRYSEIWLVAAPAQPSLPNNFPLLPFGRQGGLGVAQPVQPAQQPLF